MSTIIEKLGLKKIILIIIMLVFAVTIIVINKAVAEDTTPANPAFKDYYFYMEVIDAYNSKNKKNLEYNHNLTDEELSTITDLDAGTGTYTVSPVKSIEGIGKLVNLEDFRLENGLVSEMDFTKNLKIDTLVLTINKLKKLDVTRNEDLRLLNIGQNSIFSIDLTHNLKLERIIAYVNNLTSLDVTNNKKLTHLDLHGNPISNIDLSQNSELMDIKLSDTNITQLDLRNNTNLINLEIDNNDINSIDLSYNNRLQFLHLKNNDLTHLDLSHNNGINQLYLDGNHLMSLDMSNMSTRYWNDENVGTQSITLPVQVVNNNYSLNLKEHDSNLNPERVSIITDNVNYDNRTGIITFSDKLDTISYKYNTGINNAHIIVNISLQYQINKPKVISFYIGNTVNDAYTTSKNVKVNLAWDDKNITHYCISTENSSEHCVWKEASGQSVTEDYSLSSGDGEKKLYAFIKNSDGLISNARSDSIILDTTKPVVQSVSIGGSNNPDYATNTSSNVYFSYEDEDVASYCVKDTNNSSNCEWNNVTGKNMTIPYTLTSTNGTKTVYIFLKDRAGNVSVGKSDSIILDTTKPTIMAFYIGGSNNPSIITDNNTNVYLSWQDEDVASYCIKTENNTNNCDWKSVSGKSVNATYSLDETNGEKTLYAFIKDNAGLISSSKSDNVTLDSKKPIIDIFYIGGKTNPEEIGDTNTTIYLKWSDKDVTHYCVTEDSNSNNCVWKNTSGNEIEAEYILSGVNGLKTLNAYIKDNAGLISNVKSDSITLNTNKPLIKSFSINDNSKYTTNKEVTYKLVTEEENIESYCINTTNSSNNCNWINNSNQEITNTYTFDETDGIKTLYAFIKNNLEIISSVASDNIILDTTKPTITEFYIGGKSNPEYVNNKKTSIYATFKDNDIVSYCISTENKSSACEWKTINQNKIDIDYNINLLEDGTITLYLFAKDEAGLISDSKVDSIKLDTVKPMPKEFYIGSSKETNKTNSRNITINIIIEEEDIVSYCVSDTKDANKCVWKNVTSKNIKEDYVLTGDNGEKTIYLYLKDKAGNISEVKESKVLLELSNSTNNNNNSSSNNETEKDEPLQSSPQTGNRETCIIVIISGLIMLFIFYRLKKKNYIFKV